MTHPVDRQAPEVNLATSGGVRTVAPAGPRGEDTAAGALAFRVGAADEPITLRGITHLVEHLALTRVRADTIEWHGVVELTRTTFWATGPAADVARFLSDVTTALRALPADRLDHERQVLQVEGRSARPGLVEALLTRRFGLQGPGVAGYPEWALQWAGIEEVQAWADRWFTDANAVLWATASLPGLELGLLPGEHRPLELRFPDRDLPAAEVRAGDLLALASVVPRTAAHAVAARELDARLRRLRHEEGLSYRAAVASTPLSTGHVLAVATADTHPRRAADAAEAFQATLRDLAGDGVDDEALSAHRQALLAPPAEGAVETRLAQVAARVLEGAADPLHDPLPQALEQVTTAQVRDAAERLLDGAILAVPEGAADAVLPPFRPYRPPPHAPVTGSKARSSRPGFGPGDLLVYGDEGLTHWDAEETPLTIRFDACAGVVAWEDGSRMIYRTDGEALYLDAREWHRFGRVRDCVDRNVRGPVALLPGAPARAPDPEVGAGWRVAQKVVDRVGLPVFLLIVAVALGSVVGLATRGLGAVLGELTWLDEYDNRVIALTGIVGIGTLWVAIGEWRRARRRRRSERA